MSDSNDAPARRADGGRSRDRDDRDDDRRRDDAVRDDRRDDWDDDRRRDDRPPDRDRRGSNTGYLASQFTETIVRVIVALIGVILLLLALSQIVGVDLYDVVGDVVASTVGQWLLVAVFGLLLILAASKRWTTTGG